MNNAEQEHRNESRRIFRQLLIISGLVAVLGVLQAVIYVLEEHRDSLLALQKPSESPKHQTGEMEWYNMVQWIESPQKLKDLHINRQPNSIVSKSFWSLSQGMENAHNYTFYLKRAAQEGHREAQYLYANALAAGMMTSHVKGRLMEKSITKAFLFWRMAAQQGHVESLTALGTQLKQQGEQCAALLPYFEQAAHGVVDHLLTGPTRGWVAVAGDTHDLAHMHLHGFTSVKLDTASKPDETQDSLDFAHAHLQMEKDPREQADAAYHLGKWILLGHRGTPQNVTQALDYLLLATEKGHVEAAGLAGHVYLWGMGGVRPSSPEAHRLFTLGMPGGLATCRSNAKNRDHCSADALLGMGLLHLLGIPTKVSVDLKVGREMIKLAKEQGHTGARYHLAMLRLGLHSHFTSLIELSEEAGQSKPALPFKDSPHHPTVSEYKNALQDLMEAARNDHILAAHRLGMLYSKGVYIDGQRVIAPDCQKALQHYQWLTGPKANPLLNTRLRKAFGHYKRGEFDKSLVEYLQTAAMGHTVSQKNAAFLMEEGHCLGLETCHQQAVDWYQAAEQFDRVADFYLDGRLSKDVVVPTSAAAWCMRVLEWILHPEQWRSSPTGAWNVFQQWQAQIINCKESTCPVLEQQVQSQKEDWETAARYYLQATKKLNHPRANFNLGFMYQWGLGVAQDFPLAKRHYDSAGATAHEAQIPVALALLTLQWHQKFLVQYEYWHDVWQASFNPKKMSERSSTKTDVLVKHLFSGESALILGLTFIGMWLLRSRWATN